ncbi:hypothetical protein phiAS5_ORF0209 [Aeromonas phage phiAS5]|uniref:Uncharacterized protein n=1 Tax=Aeromonas phage phiAS5 TaxID=879630 RepID=E1A2V6_9CAUD|nr:hypothetical protein phiAS5_ORF0209 [Aeromonas phage phiAS5]ADM80052.1 hypothetical protein phiAS5_ORF0209 [Aeromonas phage phiAS5]
MNHQEILEFTIGALIGSSILFGNGFMRGFGLGVLFMGCLINYGIIRLV